LFLLETGILWGFKKPLMFIPLNRIAATSYTNILQRTFNVAIEVLVGEGDETEEAEFSMIDQEDYGGIDDYIKTHRLQDRSMAEQRKAKLELAENRAKKNGEEAEGAAAGGGDISELAKAQLDAEQALQDEEDEDEEDYDPGSDGDTDGSGESDDDDSDDDDEDDDEDEEDAEGEDEDEDGEGEDQAEDEEEEELAEVKKEVKKEPKKEVKKEAKVVKTEVKKEVKQEAPAPPPKPAQQPTVKTGWAALRSVPRAPAPESMDLDEEKFDVV
jgi:hypothetical protein